MQSSLCVCIYTRTCGHMWASCACVWVGMQQQMGSWDNTVRVSLVVSPGGGDEGVPGHACVSLDELMYGQEGALPSGSESSGSQLWLCTRIAWGAFKKRPMTGSSRPMK